MARLKCWEEIKSWNPRFLSIYKNKGTGKLVGIDDDYLLTKGQKRWVVSTQMPKGKEKKLKETGTKSQALRFAKSYMKKHDRCRI